MLRRLVLLSSFLGFTAVSVTTAPAFAGVMLQGFYWDAPSDSQYPWWDRLANESHGLAQSGFTSVWIPPVLKGAAGGYSNGYDPFDDYDLGSKDQRSTYPTRWGNREQLMRSVAMMRANGLEVYVDNVLAHRNGDWGDSQFRYRNALGSETAGRFPKYPDYFYASNGFGRQLNHSHVYVREHLIHAGDWMLNALGAQGFRIDMATKVDNHFLKSYLNSGAMAGHFTVTEYWSEDAPLLENYVRHQMQGRVSTFDFPLWGLLKDMSNQRGFFDMQRLVKAGLIARAPEYAVTFVENHDTDRGYPTTSNKHLGYAYILTSEGYPSVFWKDYFEYGMKPIIDPLIWIHEKLASGPTEWRWSDEDLIIYERQGGSRLLVGINDNAFEERTENVQTAFGAWVKLHDYTGHGPDIHTDSNGRVWLKVPANSYVAYAPWGMSWPHPVKSHTVEQQFAGAEDLDIPPALRVDFQRVGRIYAQAGTWIDWNLHLNANWGNAEGQVHIMLIDPSQMMAAEHWTPSYYGQSHYAYRARATGWHEFKIKIVGRAGAPEKLPYWLNVKYQAPQKF